MKLEDVQIDMKVRYHPVIGGKHDGNTWTVRGTGMLFGREVAWLEGKPGAVAAEALSVPEPSRPEIVCLCGSTRFWRTFQEEGLRETLAGRIVLSIGAARCADGDDRTLGGYVPAGQYDAVKEKLDELHKRKIDLCDEVLVLNVGGYIGDSTSSEIAYAHAHGKPVRYLEAHSDVKL